MTDLINDYAVGRGKLFFDKFINGTKTGTGERYLGNTPTFSLASTVTSLDHFSSDYGVKEKDKSTNLQVENTVTLSTDNLQFENFALWYLGEVLSEDVSAESDLTQEVVVTLGAFYQLGSTDARPEGCGFVENVVATSTVGTPASGLITLTGQPAADDTVTINGTLITFKASGAVGSQVNIGVSKEATAANLRTLINATPALLVTADAGSGALVNITAITPGTAGNAIALAKTATNITVSGATLTGGAASSTIALQGNFDVNLETGRVQVLENAADIQAGDLVTFTYDTTVISDRVRVVAAGEAIYGALRYIADNATGDNKDQYIPYCKISPDGALALKGDTWMEMSFTLEALKKTPTTPRVIMTEGKAA